MEKFFFLVFFLFGTRQIFFFFVERDWSSTKNFFFLGYYKKKEIIPVSVERDMWTSRYRVSQKAKHKIENQENGSSFHCHRILAKFHSQFLFNVDENSPNADKLVKMGVLKIKSEMEHAPDKENHE